MTFADIPGGFELTSDRATFMDIVFVIDAVPFRQALQKMEARKLTSPSMSAREREPRVGANTNS